MAVKIVIRRKVPKEKEGKLVPLLIQLRALATAQPGYISGETLRNIEQPEDTLVISTWQRQEDWDAWARSAQRAEIQRKVDALLGETTQYSVYYYG